MFEAPKKWSSKSMKAAQIEGIRGRVSVAEVQVPELDPDDALVRVIASGICRSDWHLWNGDWEWVGMKLQPGAVLGHEIGGIVEAVGSNVRSVRPGQKVTVPFNLACGHCHHCSRGEQNVCDNAAVPHLIPGSGGWAQYMRAPNANLNCVPLPDGVDELTAAALGCRYMTAWRAIQNRGALRGGETVAVFGCGGVGQAAIEIAASLGGRVIAVDVDDAKLARAREIGAHDVVNAKGMSPEKAGEAVRAITERDAGVDLAVDALGSVATVHGALHSLRKGGRLSQVGLTSQAEKGIVAIPMDMIVLKELEIRGSLGNPQSQYGDLLGLVASRKLNPTALVSRTVSLRDVESVLHDMDSFKTSGYVVITDFR
ncbi:alcohol dehydrogenase catalytic domain-containing protein (plasmid) [Agrobacterium salinitolerans]|uniref:Alcohol dehydrogenase catalytic domain-containing protein n=1 Tax=Agrobacterium salinitolerans TaxID=1183413 RepID=A0A9X9PC21_9HYPH|nr:MULTISPECIES: alcohol dehydrogenase catalytic domain-containing protein [Agrobacterium]MDH6298052.1 D-arabinose 1-dehydrogenase-like Zn-dependent alcohol dehydrogenase [Agrobacterium fabrum]UYZ10844.1 alcohol dehydrogenase catalytic domain-containing protein [Agrobacterium salinitolerans]